jgi:hypothetical protein
MSTVRICTTIKFKCDNCGSELEAKSYLARISSQYDNGYFVGVEPCPKCIEGYKKKGGEKKKCIRSKL